MGSVGLSGDFIGAFGGESSAPAALDNLVHRMEKDEFDLIAVVRALLSDPNWVTKVKTGKLTELEEFQAKALGSLA